MDLTWLLAHLRKEWEVIRGAPGTFVLWAAFLVAGTYFVVRTLDDRVTANLSSEIDQLAERVRLRDDQIAKLKNDLEAIRNSGQASNGKILKPLIAYGPLNLLFNAFSDGIAFRGFEIIVNNVSEETIQGKTLALQSYADGVPVYTCNRNVGIVQRMNNLSLNCEREAIRLPLTTKEITIQFDLTYDSIPATGERTSHRNIRYDFKSDQTGTGFVTHILEESEK